MRCPECEQKIHRTATVCPHCGYSLSDSDRVFGSLDLEMRTGRLGDGAGLLRRAERKRVAVEIRRFSRRFPQLFFAVRTVAMEQPVAVEDSVNLRQFAFWLLNRAEFVDLEDGTGKDGGVLLVIDAESRSATLTWGYRVDSFLDETDTFKILSKAHPYFLEGDWCRGIATTVKNVDKLLRRRWWKALMGLGGSETRHENRRRPGSVRRLRFSPGSHSGGNKAKA